MSEESTSEPGSDGFSATGQGRTLEECQDMIRRSLRTPTVKFLREHLEKAGCGIGEHFMKAVNCDKQISGGYVRGEGLWYAAIT